MMLEAFRWDRRYELNIDQVDAQHHHLVDMLNTLIEVVTEQRQAGEDEILALLDGLGGYAREHFSDEEALMAKWGCDPRHIAAHTRQHQIFADQIRVARNEYLAAGRPRDILELLASFVTTWLSFHILGSDRDMAGQIARIRAGQPAERRSIAENEQEGGATRILVEAMGRLYELMAQRNLALAAARDELAALNATLEERVVERTAALQSALREVDRTREQLLQSEKMSAIGQLAAGVAHEINNPVGFVSSNLGSLRQYVGKLMDLIDRYDACIERMNPSAAARDELRQLRQQADLEFLRTDIGDLLQESSEGLDRVKKIVQDMKAFSHVDHAEWQETDLNAVLESTLNVVWHELKYKAEVVRQYGDIPRVRCLPAQLSQVLMNILVNAAQAIEQSPGRITLSTREVGEGVELVIQDNGKGMSTEVLKHIFEPFFTTKPVGKGTGLGMSISYEIVKRHGGQIRVDSQPGEGSRFTVQLPLVPPAEG
jgi:two-component system, NtrC family, sensor kinase